MLNWADFCFDLPLTYTNYIFGIDTCLSQHQYATLMPYAVFYVAKKCVLDVVGTGCEYIQFGRAF